MNSLAADVAEEKRQRRVEICRRYRNLHPDQIRDSMLRSYRKHKVERDEKSKRFYGDHPDYYRNYHKNYIKRKGNKEKALAANRRWYQRNAEAQKQRQRKYYHTMGPERREHFRAAHRKSSKNYRLAHPGICTQRTKDWFQKHPEKRRHYNATRRAAIKGDTSNQLIIKSWIASVLIRKTNTCYYCHRVIPKAQIHFDHIRALSAGGSHSIENLAVTCAACNLSKGSKPIEDWYRLGQQVLEL